MNVFDSYYEAGVCSCARIRAGSVRARVFAVVCVWGVCVHSAAGLVVLVLFFVFHLLDARIFYFFEFFY